MQEPTGCAAAGRADLGRDHGGRRHRVERGLQRVRLLEGDRELELPTCFALDDENRIAHAAAGLAMKGEAVREDRCACVFVSDLDVVRTLEAILSDRLSGSQDRPSQRGGCVHPGPADSEIIRPRFAVGHLDRVELDVDVQDAAAAPQAKRLPKCRQHGVGFLIEDLAGRSDFAEPRAATEYFNAVTARVGVKRFLLERAVIVGDGDGPLARKPKRQLLADSIRLAAVFFQPLNAAGVGADVNFEELVP